jgi:hypothetical protein
MLRKEEKVGMGSRIVNLRLATCDLRLATCGIREVVILSFCELRFPGVALSLLIFSLSKYWLGVGVASKDRGWAPKEEGIEVGKGP